MSLLQESLFRDEEGKLGYQNVSLTAFVLSALSEARGGFTGVSQSESESESESDVVYLTNLQIRLCQHHIYVL